ncbi:MAG: hypothetical protein KatS3mg071_0966 [Meiothermus sp.]|nr:MAG: hypothetical protein KatS3mg071_0966 [Meiothermus sp.]
MRILVTNDDGIYSPGLLALAEVAAAFGEVRVVAPDVEQSAMGQAITITRPLHYRATPMGGLEAYRVNGTPADCVVLGTHHWDKVDLVLSGINLGSNLGHEIWHSGTVAAAKQAALLGIPAIAFSALMNGREPEFDLLKPWVGRVLEALLREPRPFLINVNLPPNPKASCGPGSRCGGTRAGLCPAPTPWAGRTSGLWPTPTTSPRRAPTAGRWATTLSR